MAALDVVYAYNSLSAEFTINNSMPSSLQNARGMITFGLYGFPILDTVAMVVDGAGIQANTTYEEAYSLELARQVMAKGAALYIQQDTMQISRELQIIETKIDLVPFLLIPQLYDNSCIVVIVLVQALMSLLAVPYINLARAYITDPVTIVHAMKFGIETENDRLYIGEIVDNGTERFGVRKEGETSSKSS
ncbi:hypothetical protein BDQ17DRAFT_1358164 [Cyathus striatus]|nr:hypothetical protein BDQ17DRAFT_1358164 [Cyathus striatus]